MVEEDKSHWVAIGKVLTNIVSEQIAEATAWEAIWKRLTIGILQGRAQTWIETSARADTPMLPRRYVNKAIPQWFWESLTSLQAAPTLGDFVAECLIPDLAAKIGVILVRVELLGVKLAGSGLAEEFPGIAWEGHVNPKRAFPPGRPPAGWWQLLAIELALYVHDHGIPAGKGTQGVEAIVGEMQLRLEEKGFGPDRTSLNKTIGTFLKRQRGS